MRKLWYDVTLPAPRAVVLSLHGGAEHGHEPVGTRSGSVWRSRRLVHAIRSDLHAEDVAIARLRFAVKGWNDPESPSPVADARWEPRGTALVLNAVCTHPAVEIALRGHIDAFNQVLTEVQRAAVSDDTLSVLATDMLDGLFRKVSMTH